MRRVWLGLRIVLAVGLLAFVLARTDPGAALVELRRAPTWVYVVPAALLALNSVLHAARIRLLTSDPPAPWGPLVRAVFMANFFGLFLPTGGGEAAKVLALARHVGGVERAAGALVAVRVLELVPWALLLVWGAVGVLPGRLPELVPVAWGTATLFGAILLGAAATYAWGDRVLHRLPAAVQRRLAPMARVAASPRRLLLCGVLAFPFAGINVLAVLLALWAHHAPIDGLTALGLVPAVDVVVALPITIAGVGLREGMFVHAFGAWGVAEPVALAVAFTRWSGELGRAGLGGLLFSLAPDRRADVTPGPPGGG